jgi:GDP-mannose 6-dehydrogenase
LRGADVAVVSSSEHAVREALLATPPPHLIDISGRLGTEVESLPGYEGLGW